MNFDANLLSPPSYQLAGASAPPHLVPSPITRLEQSASWTVPHRGACLRTPYRTTSSHPLLHNHVHNSYTCTSLRAVTMAAGPHTYDSAGRLAGTPRQCFSPSLSRLIKSSRCAGGWPVNVSFSFSPAQSHQQCGQRQQTQQLPCFQPCPGSWVISQPMDCSSKCLGVP